MGDSDRDGQDKWLRRLPAPWDFPRCLCAIGHSVIKCPRHDSLTDKLPLSMTCFMTALNLTWRVVQCELFIWPESEFVLLGTVDSKWMNQILALCCCHTCSACVALFTQPKSKLIKLNFHFLKQIHTDHVLRIIGVDAPYSLVVAHKGQIIFLQRDILETLQHGKIPL